MSTPARTTKQVTDALQAAGYKGVQLMKGKGYFYFTGRATAHWKESRVFIDAISKISVERWIKEYERLAQQDKRADHAAFEADVFDALNSSATGKKVLPFAKLRRVQEGLIEISKHAWNDVLPQITRDLFKNNGLTLLDADGTPWHKLLSGAQGEAFITVGLADTTPTTTQLHLKWKKEQGKYQLYGALQTA